MCRNISSILVSLSLLSSYEVMTAYSMDRNVWQEHEFYLAVGLSEDSSEIKAREESCNSARKELIGYLFGVNVTVDQKVSSSLSEITLSENVSISSDAIKLVGTTTEISKQNNLTKCVLKYSIQEAEIEKHRIEMMAKTLQNQKLNKATFENADPTHFGVVTIKTNVKNAKLFLDSVLFGKTPIEIDRVPVGKHTLVLEATDYKPLSQTIEVGLGERKNLFLPLERNLSELHLQVLPDSARAQVWLDGIQRGSERRFTLEPGSRVLRVEAEHFFSSQDRLKLSAGQILKHVVTLSPKKVHVTFISKNQKARVYIAGTLIGETTIEKEFEPGKYAVQFITDSSGIFFSKEIDVKAGKAMSIVAEEKPLSNPTKLKKGPVMVYSDLSFSNGMSYSKVQDVPKHSDTLSPVHVILDGPTTGFISIDGKWAGTQEVILNKIDRAFTVKVEAPGYYSDEIKVGILPKEKNFHCDYVRGPTYSEPNPCPDPELLRMNEVIVDPYSTHVQYITIHPFKIIPQSPDTPLASIVLIPKEGFSHFDQGAILSQFSVNSEFYLDWLKVRFRGFPFISKAKRLNSIMYTTIPGTAEKIPAVVFYRDERTKESPTFSEINATGEKSSLDKVMKVKIRSDMEGIEVVQRVIVIN